ncbi:hypothetical protein [Brevibacillus borstelensis]|uniref:hypothetical protein n=1 Tax=Brevibacillus borstelensis TaxID=45462 RepID=UPI000469766E|nr:hypothetical protein [Brevibacillus borstelensis]MCC0567460.1 hypothetical protein [Brevibacillus borstelensis]MCM3473622.1 hypothetical protein [Brevibacillus borstelensis]MCM3561919.1 hypothetical protein [Brevibacillus borstelensis]MCM3594046.1 hypothetical protein [Brevibacillus borstelensis]MED1853563.1 hypothetical protein [Brevibacillus borstelensis]
MSREKKFSNDDLFDILHKFFQGSQQKDYKQVSFSNIARFANEQLHIQGIEYYHFARNPKVKQKIEEFKKTLDEDVIHTATDNSYFATLNVKEFLKANRDNPDRLIKHLTNLQEMHRKLYDRTIDAETKVRELEQKLVEVTIEKTELKAKYKELKKENDYYKQENRAYKTALEVKEEGQLIEALNSTGLYLVQKENGETIGEGNENIEKLDDINGKNLEKMLEQYDHILD